MKGEPEIRKIFGLFAEILEYPHAGLADKARECVALITPFHREAAAGLARFHAFTEQATKSRMEEIYTHTFDLMTVCYPYAGYHLFGESYTRGAFMVKLKEHYLTYGFSAGNELPDHICVILRFLAILGDKDQQRMLIEECMIPVLKKMKMTFVDNDNPYGEVIKSLLLVLKQSSSLTSRGRRDKSWSSSFSAFFPTWLLSRLWS